MDTTIDTFTKQLSDSLKEVEDLAKSLKNTQSLTKKTQSKIQSKLDEAEALRQAKKLEHLADNAEDYATHVIVVAKAMLEEAKAATSVAINTRLDAEVASGNMDRQQVS
jgi:Mrp family chromosome partitioning ATPase